MRFKGLKELENEVRVLKKVSQLEEVRNLGFVHVWELRPHKLVLLSKNGSLSCKLRVILQSQS